VVTVEEYLKKAYATVKLPSGFEFKVKTFSALDILEVMGDIPMMQELMANPTAKKENVKKELSKNTEFIKKLVEIIPQLVEKSIIEPEGIKWEQLDGRDKDMLMEHILSQFSVDKNITSFREEQQ
jgi:hypothetical protein